MVEPFTVLVSFHDARLRQRLREVLAAYQSVELVAQCPTGEETVEAIQVHEPQVVVLDMQMPDRSALEVVEAIGAEAMPSVVFLTEFDSTILRAFEVHAVNYLLLPFDAERFQAVFERALRQTEGRALAGVRRRLARLLAEDEEGSKERRIPVRNAGRVHYVDLDDIRWVEEVGTFVRLHLDDRTHVVKADLDELSDRFADDFARIHSILVRTSEIAEILRTEDGDPLVKLRDGRHIRLSEGDPPEIVS